MKKTIPFVFIMFLNSVIITSQPTLSAASPWQQEWIYESAQGAKTNWSNVFCSIDSINHLIYISVNKPAVLNAAYTDQYLSCIHQDGTIESQFNLRIPESSVVSMKGGEGYNYNCGITSYLEPTGKDVTFSRTKFNPTGYLTNDVRIYAGDAGDIITSFKIPDSVNKQFLFWGRTLDHTKQVPFLLRLYDFNSNFESFMYHASAGFAVANSAVTDDNGNIYLACLNSSGQTDYNSYRWLILGVDKNLNMVWNSEWKETGDLESQPNNCILINKNIVVQGYSRTALTGYDAVYLLYNTRGELLKKFKVSSANGVIDLPTTNMLMGSDQKSFCSAGYSEYSSQYKIGWIEKLSSDLKEIFKINIINCIPKTLVFSSTGDIIVAGDSLNSQSGFIKIFDSHSGSLIWTLSTPYSGDNISALKLSFIISGSSIAEPTRYYIVKFSQSLTFSSDKKLEFNLKNYPNPFNPTTIISFELPKSETVTIEIYDMLGRKIYVLINKEDKNAGIYNILWDGSNYSSGVYFCMIVAGYEFRLSKRMLLIK